jgi:hypothetical protein
MAIGKLKFYNLLVILLFIISCDPADNRLRIENTQSYSVYYTYSSKERLEEDVIRIGVNFASNDSLSRLPEDFYLISPKSIANAALTSSKWEAIASESKNGKIYFFFLSKETLINYSWREIVRGNKYLGKASYTIKDLKNLDWKITFPSLAQE